MKKFPAVLIGGLAVMLLTIVLYFTILSNIILTAIHFISLVAILLSEGITTFYLWRAQGSPRGIAAAVVSVILIPFSVVLSVVYILNFPEGYGTYLGWYIAGALVVNLLCFVLMRFDSNRKDEDNSLQFAKNNMLALRKLVKAILAEPAAQPFAARLNALEEKLHFSNDSIIRPADEKIRTLLVELLEKIADPAYNTEETLCQLEKLAKTRDL